MSWNDSYLIDVYSDKLNKAAISAVHNNINEILDWLDSNGYSPSIPSLTMNINYETGASLIRTQFNNIESLINATHNAIDWIDPYYKQSVTWSIKTTGVQEKVQRWIDWLNFHKNIVDGTWIGKPDYITDNSGNTIFDLNENDIYCYSSYF